MNKIRKSIITAGIVGGSLVGLAGVTGFADAASSNVDEVTDRAVPAALVGDDGEAPSDADRAERRAARQEQRQEKRQAIADAIGISVEDLAAQLADGATLAEVAEANGADVADVVAVIVEHKTERIDTAVENGRLTADEAGEITADLAERVQTRVEERTFDGEGRGHRGDRGPRGERSPDGVDDAETSTADTTDTTDAEEVDGEG